MRSVHVIKVSRPSTQSTHALQHPSVCIVAQGAKSVMIGEDVYGYEAAQVAVYSGDIPVAAQITRASHAAPYLTLKIDGCARRHPHAQDADAGAEESVELRAKWEAGIEPSRLRSVPHGRRRHGGGLTPC